MVFLQTMSEHEAGEESDKSDDDTLNNPPVSTQNSFLVANSSDPHI